MWGWGAARVRIKCVLSEMERPRQELVRIKASRNKQEIQAGVEVVQPFNRFFFEQLECGRHDTGNTNRNETATVRKINK